MPTGDAYSSGHLVLSLLGLAFVLLVETSDNLYQFVALLTDLTFLLNLTFHQILVSIEHLQWVWHAYRGRLLLRTPGPVLLGLAYVLLVETTILFRTYRHFTGLCSSNIPRYFLDFAWPYLIEIVILAFLWFVRRK